MVEIFQSNAAPQTAKHFSTLRTTIPVFNEPSIREAEDFCTCIKNCIPDLKFLTDEIGTNAEKNDFFSMYQNSAPSGTHTIHIVIDGVETLVTDDTYGKYYDGVVFQGYRFDAYKIWLANGYGSYSFIMRSYNSFGTLIETETSPTMRLKRYTDREANGTVRIETQKNGSLRHGKKYFNLNLNTNEYIFYWRQQVRFPGALKLSGLPTESNGIVNNTVNQFRVQTFDTMSTEYDLQLNLLSTAQIEAFLFDDLFANTVLVSDYNVRNFKVYRNLKLRRLTQEFQPRVAMRKTFTIKMINAEEKYEKYND
jgi:hypothetical protein